MKPFSFQKAWVAALCAAYGLGSASCSSGGASSGAQPLAGAGGRSEGVAGSSGSPSAGAAGTVSAETGGGAGAAGSGGGGGAAGLGGVASSAGTAGAAGSSGAAGGGGMTGAALTVSPSELVFAVVQQTQSAPQTFTLHNGSATPVQLESVKLDAAAPGSVAFELVAAPLAGASIAAGADADVQVRFHPAGVAEFQSSVSIATTSPPAQLKVSLFGLGTKGLEGANEPFLKAVLNTLGFAVNVGGAGLLGTGAGLVGDEVAAPHFKAASAAAVELTPVARYSPQERIPYGYYTAASEVEVGVIQSDQFQALYPATEAGSKPSFAAPAGEFGLFTSSKTHETYTEDAKNAGNATKHAVRSYPLKDRAGAPIANAYLVCFEEAANGDYQDYVFTLKNVVAVVP